MEKQNVYRNTDREMNPVELGGTSSAQPRASSGEQRGTFQSDRVNQPTFIWPRIRKDECSSVVMSEGSLAWRVFFFYMHPNSAWYLLQDKMSQYFCSPKYRALCYRRFPVPRCLEQEMKHEITLLCQSTCLAVPILSEGERASKQIMIQIWYSAIERATEKEFLFKKLANQMSKTPGHVFTSFKEALKYSGWNFWLFQIIRLGSARVDS